MLRITLKNIPECFKNGGLYSTLIENDDTTEEIELPEKHATFAIDFKICDPTINTLIRQLETVRFWCLTEIPYYVFDTIYYLAKPTDPNCIDVSNYNFNKKTLTGVDYSIFTENQEFMYFLETYEYKKEIRYVLDIDTYEYHILVTCCIHGFHGYFKYAYQILKKDCDTKSVISRKWALRSNNSLISMIVLCQKMTANYGQIDILKTLLQIHHCENLFPKLLEMAAEGGHIDCMKYLFEELSSVYSRIKWTADTCHKAAKNGHLDCLKFAHENGATWGYGVACAAAEYGHYDCYKYLHENGCNLAVDKRLLNQHICNSSCFSISANIHTMHSYCMWKHSSCNLAAANGHYECLKYGIDNGSYVTIAALAFAAKYNHEKCIYYLVERNMASWNGVGVPYLSIVISFIIENNRFDILKTIYEKYNYCPFEPNHPNMAARTGNVEMVLYVIDKMEQQNSHYYDNICRNACRAPSVNALKTLRELGFPMGTDCLYAVAEKGNIETFKYVLDILGTDGINPDIVYTDIVKRGDLESLKYFYSFGFPIPIPCIIQCIISGDYPDCLDYLYEKIQLQCDIAPFCIYAAKHDRINCLKRIHEKYRQPLDNCLYWGIINNNIDIVKYVWEEESKNLTWNMYQNVVKKKYTEIRIFIETNVNINELCRKHREHKDTS